jgi:hypothetical protein
VFCVSFNVSAGAGELVLEPQMMTELNAVLKTSVSLHQSLVGQDDEQVELSLRDMLWELDHAKTLSAIAKPYERAHLVRILEAAHDSFSLMQSAYGDERRERLVEGYNQLVNLARIYHLDPAYGIFFCPKDKTTWVQRGSKPQNPFHGEAGREPCGIKVPR